MPSEARTAREDDVAHVALLLHAAAPERSLDAYERALRARIADDDGGTLIAAGATLSWALDGGALFLYDLVGAGEAFAALIACVEGIARRRLAAVLAATLYDDDPVVAQLEVLEFARDWTEPDASGGRVRTLLGLVRPVGGS
ncbi:MAG: hypothetical protein KGM44_08615 [bacterium]|nr:hypothetical protein [bacterium]